MIRRTSLCALVAVVALAVPASASGPAPTASQFETTFMTETVDHHNMGVEMAILCMRKGTRADLRELCARIAKAQLHEIGLLQGWLRAWYGIEKQPEVTLAEESELRELAAMRGRRFSEMVSQLFIEHHRMFLPDALECVDDAEHVELRSLCVGMYEDQSREIRQFRRILRKL